jgi:hypothetical protein
VEVGDDSDVRTIVPGGGNGDDDPATTSTVDAGDM